MQQYDARGHPVNPESRTLGRQLRRAKNDILSTMGIVVSGEDRSVSTSNEQKIINQIAAENDFGLVITTLDQLFVFFGTWWSSSLTGRIQTYKHYTHAALLDVIRSERGSTGIFGFYFAGIPAWAVSSGLASARDNPLKRVFATARDYILDFTGSENLSLGVRSLFILTFSAVRSSVLLLSVETYMYSLLQSLALVPSNSIPSARLLLPFGEGSLIQLPPLPTDLSLPSMGGFLAQLLVSPGVLTFLYAFYLRPNLEERIYRLIRRQLPKPTIADELSIRVAYDENLIDWVVPTLGRRSEEETRRARLSLLDDIEYELVAFRGWVSSFFGLFPGRALNQQAIDNLDEERIENLRNSIESLQHELEEVQLRNNLVGDTPDAALRRLSGAIARTNAVDIARPDLPAIVEDDQASEEELDLRMNQVLTNENRISQSPGEMSSDYFSEMATLGRTSAQSATSLSRSPTSNAHPGDSPMNAARDRHSSRSNTLFSRPSSPETSPPTSPRVRASLIHQSSDIITMQLELLGNRNRSTQNQTSARDSPLPRVGRGNPGLRPPSTAMDRRSIAEFLEALILSQAQRQASQQLSPVEHDGLSNITAEENSSAVQDMPALEPSSQVPAQQSTEADHPPSYPAEETLTLNIPNIFPDGVEEPGDGEINSQLPSIAGVAQNADPRTDPVDQLLPIGSRVSGHLITNNLSGAHRVTLLSAHPVDSLASHLAAIISTIILSPIEALCLRSLAHSYLALHPSSTTRSSDLYPIGFWLGGSSWSDVFAYNGRMILMRGMQAALRAGVWGFLVGSTMRIGRKFCGWGTL
ncbi:uncharacterized protein N7482_002105 [Penicillium canariense]|uniref:Uncharacterized protein n=1 Tax=Penicillium canariense TaxID=189055 RepID=A0A9W9IEM0_9EURO|nr:uncharacterized protein N7482_002105 [Penicillium canariense]KAJ5176228.1 hypothetical protein N7482_002105 [Penicillium canariense]